MNTLVDGIGETRGILTMGLTSIEDTNSQNKTVNASSSFADKNFIMWGNNNASLDAAPSTISVDMSANIAGLSTNVSFIGMQRIWKVVETGDVDRVQISIPENAVRNITPPGNYLMFISDTGVFTPTAQYRVMTADGSGNLVAEYDFPANSERYITFGYAPEIIVERSINFDASASNYIDVEDNLDLNTSFTLSTWVKRESGSTNSSIIAKRDVGFSEGYDLRINNSGRVEMRWRDGVLTRSISSLVAIPEDEWHHIAVTHDGTTAQLYIDGVLETSSSLPLPADTSNSFLIGAAGRDGNTTNHFEGNIDEVRVWNQALTVGELRFLMNQELEDNPGTIGKYFNDNSILPTKNDASGLDFSNLRAYFPMSRYTYTNTDDESGNNLIGYLRQLRTVDFQTAPLPYRSTQNGDWETNSTWVNGSMQYIPGSRSLADNDISVDWNIVETAHDITIDNTSLFDDTLVNLPDPDGNDNEGNRTVLAHVQTAGTITVDGDNTAKTGFGYTVTHYLEMSGTFDLEGESQLIQTTDSDLILGPSGELEKDQQGTTNTYHYNYWSAPVGNTSIAPASLNPNRYSYAVTDIMFDGGSGVNFSATGYDGANTSPVTIADYWIWKFANQTDGDYSQWQHVRRTGTILPGEGFTMKGPGSTGTEQNYTFRGSPNNANINLTISQYNDYLVGNPYASAIDARQFIIDNGPTLFYDDSVTPEADATTSGTLYFWEHWGGGDHILQNYQGGYGTYNLAGSIAAPFSLTGTSDPDVSQTGSGTKAPGRYIPVGQGFFVVAANGGTINFNNGQRVFKKESAANGVFFRNNTANQADIVSEDSADPRTKIKLGFESASGQHRQLLLTIDDNTTPGVDWGYDAITYEFKNDDMFWAIDNNFYVIQASNSMEENTSYPLIIYTSEDGDNSIKIDELVNI
ncbi:LamG domain-containing protein, partial [Winogradskyella wandonensis]|uniref:LamG domain-containing protein n=1 Tax=Winogradskyella wandonensis TaxID=1442586 RepID=UPI0018EEB76D